MESRLQLLNGPSSPIELEIQDILEKAGVDPTYAKQHRLKGLELYKETLKKKMDGLTSQFSKRPYDYHVRIREALHAEHLQTKIASLDKVIIPYTRQDIAKHIPWIKSIYNSRKKHEVVVEIWSTIGNNYTEKTSNLSLSYSSGGFQAEHSLTLEIFRGSPYLITDSTALMFEGFDYKEISWDEHLIAEYHQAVNQLAQIDYELSTIDLGISPSLGANGHETLISILNQKGYPYIESQRLAVLLGFILDLQGLSGLKKINSQLHDIYCEYSGHILRNFSNLELA
ncbi:hypothetical protein [uncultured Amphritea sp.]|uniref:hypothetical protein n=1 Tax=uncultured Amphritea sp. TaxID=981605 RepID=UPI00263118B5|nr:hypothetical protein [uncultured Amphritea sp.]